MVLTKLEDLISYCVKTKVRKKLAVIKCEDDHTLAAVMRAHEAGIIIPILIGDRDVIERLLSECKCGTECIKIVDISDPVEAASHAIRMVHAGEADYLMKGTIETKTLMKTVVDKNNGMRTDRLISQVAILQNPNYHKLMALTDSALNPKPDLMQKKQIIENAVDMLHRMGIPMPKVAVLAAAETLNPKLQESVDAAELKRLWEKGEIKGCILEGPISLDLAIDAESVRIKQYDSAVGGDADLLICPDLVSGNIMGKGMEFTGAASACVIVGAKAPIVLISRAASVDNKFYSILLGALVADGE